LIVIAPPVLVAGLALADTSGSGTLGQTGSNLRGQTGSNLRGQTGSNLRGASGAAFDSIAIGPVESITTTDGASVTITVLGQPYRTTPDVADSVAESEYVAVAGDADGNLSLIYPVGSSYVPGVSPVVVRGAVTAVDASRAIVRVGGVAIDYSSHLVSDPSYAPEIGQSLEANGTQPLLGGSVLIGASDDAVVNMQTVESIHVVEQSDASDHGQDRE